MSPDRKLRATLLAMSALMPTAAFAQTETGPVNVSMEADKRAAVMERQLTDEERLRLVWGYMPLASRLGPAPTPKEIRASAGWFPAIPRLGFVGLHETDASLGVTNPKMARSGDVATALPASLALASSFDPELAFASGSMIGGEARAKGFNVLLAGGVNLTRDWYGGRNFEYLGEDPLLAGTLAGESIRGIQSRGVVSTAKHFVLNSQETLRHWLDVRIEEKALRESDLLAFRIALERGKPGAVMCAYNKVNGVYGCSNDWLLNQVLRREWGFKGWVMSDWGATHGPKDLPSGLDQESGAQLDKQVWFDKPLRAALADRSISHASLSQAVRRILRSVYATGADAPLIEAPIDYAANAAIARRVARQGIVLLKNDGALPIAREAKRILVVGRFADRGVWSGGGSSQVIPVGGPAVRLPVGGTPFMNVNGYQIIVPSSPLEELRRRLPKATIEFDSGYVPELAAARARHADLVVVFASQWQVESLDSGSMRLPEGQDALVERIASANPQTVVVLETGNPVAMPWLSKVRGVVEAWYSGQEGGSAIAEVLTGETNPSGRLPMTFPKSPEQTPRPVIPGLDADVESDLRTTYIEGADVGYRWYASKGTVPLFPFGYGLSYTTFLHGQPVIQKGRRVGVRLAITNTGSRRGADVAQLYLVARNGLPIRRLVAFERVDLTPGETRTVELAVDARLLADWTDGGWIIPGGRFSFAVGRSASDLGPTVTITLGRRRLRS